MNQIKDEDRFKNLNRAFIKTARMHRKVCHHQFQALGFTEGQPKVLEYLKDHDGCSQKDLAKNCHIQPATATSLINHLERSGLIYREGNQQDRRVTNVFLTDAGREAQFQIADAFKEIERATFEDFSLEEQELLLRFLSRMHDNLKRKESGLDV